MDLPKTAYLFDRIANVILTSHVNILHSVLVYNWLTTILRHLSVDPSIGCTKMMVMVIMPRQLPTISHGVLACPRLTAFDQYFPEENH
jgi:hypothetical protein